jgi:hypothetical protein
MDGRALPDLTQGPYDIRQATQAAQDAGWPAAVSLLRARFRILPALRARFRILPASFGRKKVNVSSGADPEGATIVMSVYGHSATSVRSRRSALWSIADVSRGVEDFRLVPYSLCFALHSDAQITIAKATLYYDPVWECHPLPGPNVD